MLLPEPRRIARMPCSWLAWDTTHLRAPAPSRRRPHRNPGRSAGSRFHGRAKRHPARIDQHPSLSGLAPITVANTETAISSMAHPDPVLDEVEEHVDPGAQLRDAFQILGEVCGRRRAEADDRAGMTVSAQNFGGAHGGRTLVLGCLHQRIGRAQAIGLAGMGEDADEVGARRRPCRPPRAAWDRPASITAMVIAIQFDEDGRRHAGGRARPPRASACSTVSSSSFRSTPVRRQSSMARRPKPATCRPHR